MITVDRMLAAFGFTAIVVFTFYLLSGCGQAGASGYSVFVVGAPKPGYTCFVAEKNGNPIGVTCARDQ